MSKFLLSCGGTGGHLSPGISLAEGLTERGHEAVLLVSQKKVDARLLEKYPQLRFERMPGIGFSTGPVAAVRFIVSQTQSVWQCLRLVRSWQPDAIVGFGGFTSAPAVLAGRVLGVPVALHESNRVPGRAIRSLGRFARRVYLPPGITLGNVRASATRHVGLPVRREIARQSPAVARAALGLDPALRTLVILGGSQGSGALNDWVRDSLDALAAENIQVYCVTGMGKGRDGVMERVSKTGTVIKSHFVAFSDRIGELLSAADLVVSRAGAGTLAELIRCETPAVLVPFPQAADDHQRANAAFFEQQGGGLVVEQTKISTLRTEVLEVLGNEWLLRQFRSNLQRMDRANSLDLMLRDLEHIIASPAASSDSSAQVTA